MNLTPFIPDIKDRNSSGSVGNLDLTGLIYRKVTRSKAGVEGRINYHLLVEFY